MDKGQHNSPSFGVPVLDVDTAPRGQRPAGTYAVHVWEVDTIPVDDISYSGTTYDCMKLAQGVEFGS